MTVLSFVVPALDEADGIEALLDEARAAAEALERAGVLSGHEVVVVDDGSTDATAAIVERRAEADPRVRLVTKPPPRGLGGALRAGLAAATGDLVLYTDADLPFDLSEVGPMVALHHTTGADLVAARRRSRRGEGARRLVYSRAYNGLVRATLGLQVRDVNFAGKLLTRRAVDQLDLRSQGSFIDVELLAQVRRAGLAVVQHAVEYHPRTRGTSSLSSPATIRTMLTEMRTLGPDLRRPRR